jgi:hypothetical protein
MKGMVFTEFIEFAEQHYGADTVDDAIEAADLESGGAYTAVGTYDYRELVAILQQLAERTGASSSTLLYQFGRSLFPRFASMYGQFFDGIDSAFDFLSQIENYIHMEVRKLYPDAELPQFECQRHSETHLDLTYRSQRGLGDLAHGLIAGCIDHFDEPLQITRQELAAGSAGPGAVRFSITSAAA